MPIRSLGVVVIAAAFAGDVAAAEVPLSGEEIARALTGNRVVGVTDGKVWEQYFYAGGYTHYTYAGRVIELTWRVEGDQYCSEGRARPGWTCYDVIGDLDAEPPTLTWLADDGRRWPGELIECEP